MPTSKGLQSIALGVAMLIVWTVAAFHMQGARVPEDRLPVPVEVFGKSDARASPAQQPCPRRTTDFPWMGAQVLAAEFEDVETVQERGPRAATFGEGGAQTLEVGHPALVHHHAFAVHGGGRDGQREDRLDDQRDAVGPVASVAAEHAHAVTTREGQ